MTYNETAAVIYRMVNAYPFYTRHMTDDMIEDMVREWHEGLKGLEPDGVMEAVTALCSEQKWLPSLSEVINKIMDVQYGTDADIIRQLDRDIQKSSTCIIFGQITDEQREGYERLTPFQRLIIKSPAEFNLWLSKDQEWKETRVNSVKRETAYGKHTAYLQGRQAQINSGFDVFKALEERRANG